jgi:thiosulfate dehydrogenase (quinone) large subunit
VSSSVEPAHASPRVKRQVFQLEGLWSYVLREVRRETIWWLPLRCFVAIGWLRAFAEKIWDSGWLDGSRVAAFLEVQLDQTALPAYAALMRDSFLPGAIWLGWMVMMGQLLVGVVLLFGFRTRAALVAGLFMNANFVAAGEPNPSAFYLVMQMALLAGGAERVFAVDQSFSRRSSKPSAFMDWLGLWLQLALMTLLLAVGLYASTRVEDFSASGSVKDPAAILAVTCFVGLGYALISTVRLVYGFRPPDFERRRKSRSD